MSPILRNRSWLRLSPRRHTLKTSVRRKCSFVRDGGVAVVLLCATALQPIAAVDAHATPPPPPPMVVEPYVHTFVDCVVRADDTETFWFGYEMPDDLAHFLVPVFGPNPLKNELSEVSPDGVVVNEGVLGDGGQVEYFLGGIHRRAFAVTVPRGHELKWTLTTPGDLIPEGSVPREAIAVTTDAPRCPKGTPRHSANVHLDHSNGPAIVVAPGPSKLDDDRRAVRTSVRFDVEGVVSVCSEGGVPLAPSVLWGYDDALTMANVGLNLDVPRDGFRPVPSRRVLRIDNFGSNSKYVRTFVATREVPQPQRQWTDSFLGVTSRGVAATMVLADVFGRCRFGDDVVVGKEPMYAVESGFPVAVASTTDEATQQSDPVNCSFPAVQLNGPKECPVYVIRGPGGSRWR